MNLPPPSTLHASTPPYCRTDPSRPDEEQYTLAYGFFGIVFTFLGAMAGIGLVAGARHYANKAPHEELSSLMPSPGATGPDTSHVRVLHTSSQREAPSAAVRSAFEAMRDGAV